MKAIRDLSVGIITSLASIVIVVGAIFLAAAEGLSFPHPTQIPVFNTAPPTLTPGIATISGSNSTLPGNTPSPTATQSPIPMQSPTQPPTCKIPNGWGQYTIMAGDTIEQIAADYQVTQTDLMAGNCLVSTTLLPGTILYIPFPTPTASPQPTKVPQPTAPATVTPIPINTIVTCGAPRGWVIYSVQAGDTLYKLSVIFGITINQLQVANCLGSSTNIYTGQRLYVPDNRLNIPTPTRTLTRTPVPTTRPSTTLSPLPTPNLTATIQKQTADAQATQAALEAASTQAALNATNTQAAINATNTQAAINATNTQAAINATNTQVAINATNTQAAINATNTQAVIDATSTQAAINAQNTQVAGSATAAAASATASYCETQAALNTPCPP